MNIKRIGAVAEDASSKLENYLSALPSVLYYALPAAASFEANFECRETAGDFEIIAPASASLGISLDGKSLETQAGGCVAYARTALRKGAHKAVVTGATAGGRLKISAKGGKKI